MAPATHLRQLGKNGPMIPALGFGLMGLSHQVYGELPSDEERFKLLDRAYELGATNWDSAEYIPISSKYPSLLSESNDYAPLPNFLSQNTNSTQPLRR